MGTFQLGQFDDGKVTFLADFNDANRNIQRVRCINTSGFNARVTLLDPAAGNEIVVQVVFQQGETVVNVNRGRMQVEPDGSFEMPFSVLLDYKVP